MRTERKLLIGVAIAALSATGREWHLETLDGSGGPNGRTNADVDRYVAVILYTERPHVFYKEGPGGQLRHTYFS